MKTHQGACHCGRVRFEVIADIDHARVCDCSICRRRGALNFRIAKENLHLLTPWEYLSQYRWGTQTACDYFCPVCGIQPFRRPSAPSEEELRAGVKPFDGWAINLRCVEGINIDALPLVRIHGSQIVIPT